MGVFLLLLISNMIKLIILSLAVAALAAPQEAPLLTTALEVMAKDGSPKEAKPQFSTGDALGVEAIDEEKYRQFRQARTLDEDDEEAKAIMEKAKPPAATYKKADSPQVANYKTVKKNVEYGYGY